tara:strand:- start:8077 stop:8544 length:468 start_codon:yes stop_codon:yes gene_type:complete
MIIDSLENSKLYGFGKTGKVIFDFLKSLNANAEEKKYELQGSDIFATVMSYETRTSEQAQYESHKKYVDVQAVLDGAEGFKIVSSDVLKVKTAYDETTDVMFYSPEPETTYLDLYPGSFVLLYPHDAHMPTLIVGDKSQHIKKVVVKVKKELLGF